MILRDYVPSDCAHLAALFHETVHTVNARDYSPEQLDAWSDGRIDLSAWNESFLRHHTVVAEENGKIVGFGDIDENGCLDRLFVHKNHQGEGIGTMICDALEGDVVITHASITAKGFFLRRGYRVIRRQEVVRNGIALVNFVMEKRK